MKTDTMLHGVNAGDVRTTHRKSLTNPLPTRFTSFLPTVPRPSVRLYIYFIAYEQAMHPLVFPSLLIVNAGRSECPLGTLRLLTYDYATGLVLCSLHVLMSMCHFWLLFLLFMDPFPP